MLNRLSPLQTSFKTVTGLVLCSALLWGCDSNDSKSSNTSSSQAASSSSASSISLPALVPNVSNLHFEFPPSYSSTHDETVTLRGSINDASSIAEVFINGNSVNATSWDEPWTYELALAYGENSAELSYEDLDGNVTVVDTIVIKRQIDLISPTRMEAYNGTAYIFDDSQNAIVSVELDTGSSRLLSPNASEVENQLLSAQAMTISPSQNALYLSRFISSNSSSNSSSSSSSNSSSDENETIVSPADPIIAVDLSSGAQQSYEIQSIENRQLRSYATALLDDEGTLYAAYDELIRVDEDLKRISETGKEEIARIVQSYWCTIDLDTGERTLVTAYDDGEGLLGGKIINATTSPESPYIYTLEYVELPPNLTYYRIAQIDKTTGEHSAFLSLFVNIDEELSLNTSSSQDSSNESSATSSSSSSTSYRTASFTSPQSIRLDSARNQLILLNNELPIGIDLDTKIGHFIAEVVSSSSTSNSSSSSSSDASSSSDSSSSNSSSSVTSNSSSTSSSQSSSSSSSSIDYNEDYVGKRSQDIILDSVNGLIYLLDDSVDNIVSIDIETGVRSFVFGTGSDDSDGFNTFQQISDLAVDEVSNTTFVSDKFLSTVFARSSDQEQKQVWANSTLENGVLGTYYPLSISYGYSSNSVYILDNLNQYPPLSLNALSSGYPKITRTQASLVDGELSFERSAIMSYFRSDISLKSLEVSRSEKEIYVLESYSGVPSSVTGYTTIRKLFDLDTEEPLSVVLSNAVIPDSNLRFSALRDITLDEERGRLLAVDGFQKAIFSIDINNGMRSILSKLDRNKDVNLANPQAIVVYENGQSALVLDSSMDAVLKINLETDEREIFVQNLENSRDKFYNPKTMAINHSFDTLYIGDDTRDVVMVIDLKTMERVTLSR